jgi:hypothetical protein
MKHVDRIIKICTLFIVLYVSLIVLEKLFFGRHIQTGDFCYKGIRYLLVGEPSVGSGLSVMYAPQGGIVGCKPEEDK